MARKDFSKLAAAQAAASRITPKQVLDTSRAAMDSFIRQKQAAQLARRQAEQEADDLYTQTVKRYFSQPDLPTRQLYAQTLKKGYANVTPQELAPLLEGSANKVAGSAWDYMTGGGRTALDRATVDKYDFLRQYQHEGVFDTERNIQTGNTSLLTDAYMQDMLKKYQEAEAKQTQQVRQQTYINQMASKNPQSEYTRQLLNQLPNYLPSGENAYDVIYDTAFAQSNNFEANDQALTTILDHLLTWDSVSNGTTKRTVDELMDIEDDEEFFREVNRLYNQASGREWVASELPEQKPYDLWVDSLEGQLARNEQEQAIVAQAYEDPEFLAKSEYDAAGYNAAYMLDESGNWMGKMYSPTDYLLYARGTDDKLYHYINGNYAPMARDAYYSTDYTNKGYHLLTSDEKAVYNYYYQQSPEEAKAYLDLIQPKLMERRADAEAKQDELYATDPITAAPTFIAGALATPLDALTGLGKAAMALSGNDDPNAPIHRLSQYKSNTAGARQAAINELEWGGLEKGLGLLDTAATSGADMAVSIGMGMALGGAGVPLATGTTAGGLMAAEAASADLTETASDDMSGAARVARSLAVGSLEMLTEKYSIDELLKTPKTLRGYLMKNILTEASEEAASSVGGTLADEIISRIDGSKSDLKEQVDQLTAAGVENAGQKVLQGFVEGVAYEALAGGVTGGLMAAGPAAATYTGRRKTGKAVVKSENVDNLISIGQSMDSTTASKELADAMAKSRDSKKKTSLADLGRLHATLLEDLNSEYHETIKQQTTDAVAQELEDTLQELGHEVEQGYSVKELAEGIVALAGDGKMNNGAKVPTKLERYIRTHQSTMITLREMNDGASDLKSRIQMERMNATVNYAERVKAVEETAKKPEEAAEEKAPPVTPEAETGTRAEKISGEIGDEVAKLTRKRPKVGTFSRLVDIVETDGATRQARVIGAKHAGGELQVIVEDEEGGRETVAYDDIDAAEDAGVASVLAYAERHSETTEEEVELMLQQIESGNDAATVIGDVTDAYDAGALGMEMPSAETESAEPAGSEEETAPGAPAAWRVQLREEAYAMGQRAAETAETARLAGTKARSRGKGTVLYMGDVGNTTQVEDSGTRQKVQRIEERLTDDQKAQVKTLEQIAKVTKMDFVLFESSAQEGEELVTPTGWYDSGSNQLYIDINSGASRGGETMVNYAILKTAAHEMTHFVENNSADEYARLRNHARQLLKEQGKDYLQMVRSHMGGERGLSRNAAEAETIADACEMMLQNTEAVKALAQRDPGLVGKIKEFVQAFVRRIRKAMASLTATSEEAKALTVVRDGVEKYIGDLQQMWDDALVAASTKKNAVKVEKGAAITEETSSEGMKQYSDRRSAPSMRQTLAAMTITEDMNQTEKYLLGKYKGYAEELTQVQAEMQAQNDIQQNADMPQEERVKAANRLGILRKRARHLEKLMRTAEGNEGFMRLMDTSRAMVRRVMNAGSYEEAAQNVSRQVAEAQANLAAAQEELAALGEEKQQELARALFDPKQLKEAAKSLKDSYGSRMSQKGIQNRLAMMYTDLYAGDAESGTRHYNALQELAEDLIKTSRGQSNERLQMLKEGIGTIRLTDVQKQELKKRGITMQAFRSVVNPVVTITNSDTASDLMAALGSSEYFGLGEANGVQALFEGYENEGDAIVRLYELIQAERESGLTADGMTEEQAVQAAMVDIVEQAALPYPGDGAAEATRRAILSAADASKQVQKRLDEAVKKINISSNAAWEAKLRAERDKGNVQAVADYYRKLENQRRAMEVAEETERIQQQITREKDNQLAEYFQRRELQEGNASLKRQIQRMVGWMDKRIRKETDQKRIPEQFKPVVEEMVRIFINANDTMRIFSKKEIAGIAYVYNQLTAIDGTDIHQLDDMYTENIEDLLEDLKASIKLFSAAEATQGEVYRMSAKHQCLEDILDVVQAVWKITQDIDTTFIDGQRVSLTKTAAQLVKEAEGKADYSRKKGAAGKAWEGIKKEIRNGNLTPVYFFKMLGLDTMTKLNEDFGNAEEKHAFLHDDAHKRLMSIMEKHSYWDWKDDEPLTFTTLQGQETDAGKHTISLKKGEALLVYATWKREHSGNPLITSSHLENGGFTLASGIQEKDGREYADGTPHRLSEADMRTIGNYLTEEQKAFADEIVEYLSQEIGELGNETSMMLFGIRKFKEAYYIPMRVQRDQLAQRSDAGARRGSDTNRIAHMSASKRRVDQARKPLVIGDFMDVVAQHVDQMLLYNTFAIPIENMNRILNQSYVEGTDSTMTGRALIKQKYGEDVAAYLSRYIADLNGGPQKDNVEKSIWSKGLSLYKKSAVVASLSVAVQQPTSVIRAMMEVNPKYFVPIANHKDNVNWGKEWEQLKQYSGVALIKERGGFDMTSGRGTAEALKGNREENYKFWAKARLALLAGDAKGAERWKAAGRQWENAFGWMAQKADQITWAYMWRAVKAETAAKNPGMDTSSEAFLQEAGRRFSEVMRLTQVYDSTLVRSQNMRSNTVFAKMATSFMAEPTLTANILLDAVQSKDMKKIAKATGNFVISAIVTAAAAGLVKAGRDDDQSKPWVEKWLASIGNQLGGWSGSLNPLALVPGLRDVMSLMDGYDIERADMSLIDDLLEVGNKLFSGKYDEDPMKGVEDVITNAANMLGIPVKNLLRDAKMLVNTVTGLADPPREANALVMANDALKNFTYRPFFTPDTSISAYYKKLYDAMKAGNAQKQEELLEYMRIQGKDEQAISTGVRKVVEEKLATGDLTEEGAKAYLLQNGLAETEKDAYEYVEKWLYKQENGGTDGFSMYNDFYTAVESGKDLKKTVDMYLKMGVEAKTLASRITSEYKQQYINLMKTNRSAAAQLQVRLLTAYQALGYDRDKKLKDIQKWLEE